MRDHVAYYHILTTCAHRFGLAQVKCATLALWVYGLLRADSCSETEVVAALSHFALANSIRQRLRKWLKADWQVNSFFAPLLCWFLSWAKPGTLVLAFDASLVRERYCLLCVSIIYRGTALPLAWRVLEANKPEQDKWAECFSTMFKQLHEAMPTSQSVLVLTDRGLHSPTLWQQIISYGWHPLFRERNNINFRPAGGVRQKGRSLVSKPGCVWVGRGVAFGSEHNSKRELQASLIVIWLHEEDEAWLLLTDLEPQVVRGSWYALRMNIEQGFRELKSMGWQWQHSRRTQMERVERHLLVVAVAQLYTLALGTRQEDEPWRLVVVRPSYAFGQGVVAHSRQQHVAVKAKGEQQPRRQRRQRSVFKQGRWLFHVLIEQGQWLSQWWLHPEPLPDYASELSVYVHSIEAD
jgi:Transposase DDE domain